MTTTRITLAIETTCDDTSIAIMKGRQLLSLVTKTTAKQHASYGGIVPEIAARGHEQNLSLCFLKAIKQAKIYVHKITKVIYASEPGMPGSLHVGKIWAQSIAYLLNAELIPVNHIIAHLFAFAIDRKEPIKYPFIGLVVSGGHTIIYLFKNINEYQILTKTADDAAGETLDKIGRTLGFKYPGGIAIDHNYQSRNANVKLINHADPTNDFSFSGIKTKILSDYQKNKNTKITLASSALKWIVDDILIKLNFYVKKYHVTNIVVGGGVSANRLLRKLLTQKYRRVHLPLLPYCQDNAAMIGAYGYLASIKTLR